MNNQAPIDPNMSAYEYFAHMYVNYLQSTVGVVHTIGVNDYMNYVLPVIRNNMNPFLDDSKFITSRSSLQSRMESLYEMISEIIAELDAFPDSNLIKRSIFNPLIQRWYTAIHNGGRLLSTENHIIIKSVFEIWLTLILYVDRNVLLEKFNMFVLNDYSNSNNNNNRRI